MTTGPEYEGGWSRTSGSPPYASLTDTTSARRDCQQAHALCDHAGGGIDRAELGRLDELEQVVDRGLGTFVEVGLALKEIRDSKLYRTKHATFENYCQQRWRFTRTHGHRLIVAAEVAGDLLPIGNKLLTCEAQARELGPLSAERRREVWLQVTTSAHYPPTAKAIREAILEQRRCRASRWL